MKTPLTGFLLAFHLFAQNLAAQTLVTGQIYDTNRQPLIGATVMLLPATGCATWPGT